MRKFGITIMLLPLIIGLCLVSHPSTGHCALATSTASFTTSDFTVKTLSDSTGATSGGNLENTQATQTTTQISTGEGEDGTSNQGTPVTKIIILAHGMGFANKYLPYWFGDIAETMAEATGAVVRETSVDPMNTTYQKAIQFKNAVIAICDEFATPDNGNSSGTASSSPAGTQTAALQQSGSLSLTTGSTVNSQSSQGTSATLNNTAAESVSIEPGGSSSVDQIDDGSTNTLPESGSSHPYYNGIELYIIAHSHGGLYTRLALHVDGFPTGNVKSLTTLCTPNDGAILSEIIVNEWVGNLCGFINSIGLPCTEKNIASFIDAFYWVGFKDQNTLGNAYDLFRASVRQLNADYPPISSVHYYSWASRIKKLGNGNDPITFIGHITLNNHGYTFNDGLVEEESAPYTPSGYTNCEYMGVVTGPWYSDGVDHLNMINHPFGMTAWGCYDFYRQLAIDLVGASGNGGNDSGSDGASLEGTQQQIATTF